MNNNSQGNRLPKDILTLVSNDGVVLKFNAQRYVVINVASDWEPANEYTRKVLNAPNEVRRRARWRAWYLNRRFPAVVEFNPATTNPERRP